MKCVCKSWNTLISDPTFIKMHINRSARNPHLALLIEKMSIYPGYQICSVVPIPVCHLLEKHPIPVSSGQAKNSGGFPSLGLLVGSCNGLLCLAEKTLYISGDNMRQVTCFCFCNPATRNVSKYLVSFSEHFKDMCAAFKFTFGYDNSTDTYKVVAFRPGGVEVRVFNLGDNNVWRDIQSSPAVPYFEMNFGAYLSGCIHWLALYNYSLDRYEWEGITVDQFVIISLDLSTETYTKFLLPRGFNEVARKAPILRVLKSRLCFSHDFKGTHLIIWMMIEYGVEESWTQLFKISYQNLPNICHKFREMKFYIDWLPLHLSDSCDTLILVNNSGDQAILYNWRDNRVERTNITNKKSLWLYAKDYVETLVWYR